MSIFSITVEIKLKAIPCLSDNRSKTPPWAVSGKKKVLKMSFNDSKNIKWIENVHAIQKRTLK